MPLETLAEACAAMGPSLPVECQTVADARSWLEDRMLATRDPARRDCGLKWIDYAFAKAEEGKLSAVVAALRNLEWLG